MNFTSRRLVLLGVLPIGIVFVVFAAALSGLLFVKGQRPQTLSACHVELQELGTRGVEMGVDLPGLPPSSRKISYYLQPGKGVLNVSFEIERDAFEEWWRGGGGDLSELESVRLSGFTFCNGKREDRDLGVGLQSNDQESGLAAAYDLTRRTAYLWQVQR